MLIGDADASERLSAQPTTGPVRTQTFEAVGSAAGFAFEVPGSDWGNLQVLQVTGTDGDECDFVNDRVQVDITCPE